MTTHQTTRRPRPPFVLTALAGAAALGATLVSSPGALLTSAAAAASSSNHRAAAHRVVHHDAVRDVIRFDFDSDESRPTPRDRSNDITTTVVDHRADRLVVKARARHLGRSGYRLMFAEILTADGKRYNLVTDYSTHPIDSHVRLERYASEKKVRCPDASWSIDRSANQVAASIPVSCLGDPGWVRVGVALVSSPSDLTTSSVDDSRTRGTVDDDHLKLGPRQPRA